MEAWEVSCHGAAPGSGEPTGVVGATFYGGAAVDAPTPGSKQRFSPPSPSPTSSLTPSPTATAGLCGGGAAAGVRMMGAEMTVEMDYLVMKKRGRPRKYGPDGTPLSPSSDDFSGRRVRGRPRGSGSRQLIAALGGWYAYTAGGNFSPHVITIAAGEDVAARILSFSRKGPRGVCILSANGAISNVTLRQWGSSGGTLTYEGRFEILSLSGSFTVAKCGSGGGGRSRTGGLSVSLASPDGRVVGGEVAGALLAASPIQLIVGSFLPDFLKEKKRSNKLSPFEAPNPSPAPEIPDVLTEARPISQANPRIIGDGGEGDNHEMDASPLTVQLHHSGGAVMGNLNLGSGGWKEASPEKHSSVRASPDINICLAGGDH